MTQAVGAAPSRLERAVSPRRAGSCGPNGDERSEAGRTALEAQTSGSIERNLARTMRPIVTTQNVVPAVLGSLVIHVLVVGMSSTPQAGPAEWLFVFFDLVLWSLALTPLVAVVRGDLYWGDPFSFISFLFLPMACMPGIAYWIDPNAVRRQLVFLLVPEDLDMLCEAQVLMIIFWAIVLAVCNTVPQGLREYAPFSDIVHPAPDGRDPQRQDDRRAGREIQALRVGYLFPAVLVYAWLGLFHTPEGYIERLFRISYRRLEIGDSRYAVLYSIAGYGALLLIPLWGARRRGSRWPTVAVALSIGMLLLQVAGIFPLGDRIAALILVFLSLVMIDRFLVAVGNKWLGLALAILIIMTAARHYQPEDYEAMVGGSFNLRPMAESVDWSILLNLDRLLPTAMCVAKIDAGQPFVYGETLLASLANTYEAVQHLVSRSSSADPLFWNMQNYTAYWQYGVPSGPGVPSQRPTGIVGEMFFNGGYLVVFLGSFLVALFIRWLRYRFYAAAHPHEVFFVGMLAVLFSYAIVTEVSVFVFRIAFAFAPVALSWRLALASADVFSKA